MCSLDVFSMESIICLCFKLHYFRKGALNILYTSCYVLTRTRSILWHLLGIIEDFLWFNGRCCMTLLIPTNEVWRECAEVSGWLVDLSVSEGVELTTSQHFERLLWSLVGTDNMCRCSGHFVFAWLLSHPLELFTLTFMYVCVAGYLITVGIFIQVHHTFLYSFL